MTYAAGSGRRRTEGLPAAEEVRGGGVRASSGAGRPVGVRRSCGLPFRARPLPCGPKRCDRNGQARGSTRSRCRASLALLGRCLSRSRGERTRRNWRRTLWTSLSDAMEFAKRLERWMAAPPELARTMRYLTGGAKRTQRCRRSAMLWSIRKPPRRRPCSGLQCCASLFCASPCRVVFRGRPDAALRRSAARRSALLASSTPRTELRRSPGVEGARLDCFFAVRLAATERQSGTVEVNNL